MNGVIQAIGRCVGASPVKRPSRRKVVDIGTAWVASAMIVLSLGITDILTAKMHAAIQATILFSMLINLFSVSEGASLWRYFVWMLMFSTTFQIAWSLALRT